MGKYYNTHTVPLVDYVVDFPFESLLKSKMYKQERADKTQDLLSKEKQKLLGMKVIGGKQVQDPQSGQMVYEPSDDEVYRDQKVDEYNTLIESMRGKDLSQNYGLIRQKIDDIWDPHMVDIAASRTAYDAEQKDIAKWRTEGKWKDTSYKDARGWSTAEQGEYTAQNRPWIAWRNEAEDYFDQLEADTRPDQGMEREGIDEQTLRTISESNAKAFRQTPAGQQGVADWMDGNTTLVENMKASGTSHEDIMDYAAEQVLFNTGMERFYNKLTPYSKTKGGGSGTDEDGNITGEYVQIIERMSRNQMKTATVPSGKGMEAILSRTPIKKEGIGEVYPIANEKGAVIGNRKTRTLPYYGIGETGVMGRLVEGDYDKALGRVVTPEDIMTQHESLRLLAEYRNKSNDIEGFSAYLKEKQELTWAQNRRVALARKRDLDPDFNYYDYDKDTKTRTGRKLSEEETKLDKANQRTILDAYKKLGLKGYAADTLKSSLNNGRAPIYITAPHDIYYKRDARGNKVRQQGGTFTQERVPKLGMKEYGKRPGYGPLYNEDGSIKYQKNPDGSFKLNKAGEKMEHWGAQIKYKKGDQIRVGDYLEARSLLQSIGKWDYQLEEKELLTDPLNELKTSGAYSKAVAKHQALKNRYMALGMLNPDGSDARDILLAKSEADAEDSESKEARAVMAAIKGSAIMGKGIYDFLPDATDNYFIANGKAWMSGTMYLSESQMLAMIPQGIKDPDTGELLVEGAGGEGAWIGWDALGGQLGQINLEQALIGAGFMEPVSWTNKAGEAVGGYAISVNLPRAISTEVNAYYNRKIGMGDKYQQAARDADEQKLAVTLIRSGRQAVDSADKSYTKGYKNRLMFKYNQAFDLMKDMPEDSKEFKALYGSENEEDVKKATSIISGGEVFDNLITNYEDILNKAAKENWEGASEVTAAFTPYLEVIRKFKNGGMRGEEELKLVKQAYEGLSDSYAAFIDPRGYQKTDDGGAEILKAGRDAEIKESFKGYLQDKVLDPKIEDAIKTENWTEYAKYGKQKAISQGMTEVVETDEINLSKNAYVPYTNPMMNDFIGTVGDALKLANADPITISGLYRTEELNKSLEGSVSNSLHMKGMAMDVSLNGEARKGALKLEALVKAKKIKAPAGYRIDIVKHGDKDKGTYHLHLELEKIS